jgi:hypothetical protein
MTLAPDWVTIWSFCTSDTPSLGKNTTMLAPGTSAKPSSAALPVSPLVATRMQTFRSSPHFFSDAVRKCGRICRAMSLNAQVGPCHSSRKAVLLSVKRRGAMAGSSKFPP